MASTQPDASGPASTPARAGLELGSLLVRSLGVVTDVEPAEASTALLLGLDAALLLTSYSCIKPIREALILGSASGPEYKIYMAGATALALLVAVPAYARVAVGLPRNRLIVRVTAFFASHLLAFYAWHSLAGPSLALALCFYLWIAIRSDDDDAPSACSSVAEGPAVVVARIPASTARAAGPSGPEYGLLPPPGQ